MAKGNRKQPRGEDERAAVKKLFGWLASEDPAAVRAVLRDNPELAEAVMDSSDLQQLVQHVAAELPPAELDGPSGRPPALVAFEAEAAVPPDAAPPGIFTELTRALSPERAAQLYRKVVPLVVYELLRALDQNANVATVQQVVDHLSSRAVQERLRAAAHVRDGILDELAFVLRDAGVRAALSREDVQRIIEECGVLGELMTLVRCIRLSQAAG